MRKYRSAVSLIVTVVAFGVLVGVNGAKAAIIYDNGGPNQWNSIDVSHYVSADEFTISQDALLTGAVFWTLESTPWDGTLNWYLFTNDSGIPNSTPLASGSGVEVIKKGGNFVAPQYNEYEYSFDLNTPVNLIAGSTYWFGLHLASSFESNSTNSSDIFWETTGLPLFTGDAEESPFGLFNNWEPSEVNLAFNLIGEAAVPEPPTWTMIVFGLFCAGFIMRQRRNMPRARAKQL